MRGQANTAYQPVIINGASGQDVPVAIPTTRQEVLERVNKALANDRQRLFIDGDRVVWLLRARPVQRHSPGQISFLRNSS